MLSVSSTIILNGAHVFLNNSHKKNIEELVKKLNQDGLRVVG